MDDLEVTPNQTIYINNLNEKIKKEELRKALYCIFSQFGNVLDVVALKTQRMRGQAFIVYRDIGTATNAMRTLQNFPLFDKPMRIQFAKKKSDVITRAEGSYEQNKNRSKENKRKQTDSDVSKDNKKTKDDKAQPAPDSSSSSSQPQQQPQPLIEDNNPPHHTLFLQQLPEQSNEQMLGMLFQQFPGFKEARLVPGKSGIAFVEFESEAEATVAREKLQGFKITPQHAMHVSYAKSDPMKHTYTARTYTEAIEIVKQSKAYHILVIIADGQVDAVDATSAAIVEATNYPLSIICVGVGDGPWELMEEFDDKLPKRKFDNFQFVPFNDIMAKAENREITFSVNALQEIPEQFKTIKKLGYLNQ